MVKQANLYKLMWRQGYSYSFPEGLNYLDPFQWKRPILLIQDSVCYQVVKHKESKETKLWLKLTS